jgi:subfamily B ATP-binding cassette protein MsbA
VAIFLVDWHMPLVVFILFPLVYFPIRLVSTKIRKRGRENQKSADRLLARLKEVLSNMRVVKVFAREQYESARFKSQGDELYRINMKVVRSQLLAPPIMEVVGGLLLALLVIYGGVKIQEGVLSGGDFIGLLLLIYALYDPIRHLTKMYAEVQVSQVALERIFNLYDLEPMIQGPAQPKPVPVRPALIEFDQVCFAYEQGQPVLDGISLKVEKGEIVAFVGPSGGGKSTLVNLLPRLFDPLEGRILVDGTDIKEFDPKELRTRIGVVTQETLLFMDTIHDNIAYGLNVSRAEVMEAARRAHAHDFIAQLPQGYETRLAETGSSLSGGQRQRIAIARAILQNPPVLILDEATSALDTESESVVQEALDELMKERTTLVIAHRLSTIQRANRIYVISRGRLIEQGTHEVLLAAQGEYARLHSFSVL